VGAEPCRSPSRVNGIEAAADACEPAVPMPTAVAQTSVGTNSFGKAISEVLGAGQERQGAMGRLA